MLDLSGFILQSFMCSILLWHLKGTFEICGAQNNKKKMGLVLYLLQTSADPCSPIVIKFSDIMSLNLLKLIDFHVELEHVT